MNAGVRRSVWRLGLLTAAMFGFGYAMAPLYDVLCRITGLNGKTSQVAVAATPIAVDAARTVTVEFVANVNQEAPWEFRPAVAKMQVHPGEFHQTTFYARNLSARPLAGQAVPSVAPGPAAEHFHKIECFCFTRQDFAAGEGRDMPLAFRLDPKLPPEVRTVTLSYTLFRVPGQGGEG